jgi:general nucleoside transport system ATP-binding protein
VELELRGITKHFPGVVANDHVDLVIRPGEILGLLGENGAGKSTLMNILYGLYSADEGDILVDGQVSHFASPSDAVAAGIGMVHQHFMLVPVFTVAENVILGVEPTGSFDRLDTGKARQQVLDISAQYGFHLDPDAIIEDLPVGIQQRVEIIKVLFREADIVIFDEPTAVLTPQEIEDFFAIMRSLRSQGKGIVFITHKLKEVLEIADRISVLRRGQVVGEVVPAAADEAQLAQLMVGRPVELVVHKDLAHPGVAVLQVEDLVVAGDGKAVVHGVSFEVRAGEIVAIAGVQGNGQTELVEALTGLRPVAAGRVLFDGADVTGAGPRQIHRAGAGHIPEDRENSGFVSDFSVAENSVLDSYYQPRFSSHGVMNWPAVRQHATQLVEAYDIRTPDIDTLTSTLSGGNKQKVIVAREFRESMRLVIASQPTRGVDVGSIENIHERIVAARDDGLAVLIVSTELDEVMALADRILVMFRGRIVGELDPMTTTPGEIGLYMAGAGDQVEAVAP